MSTENINQLSMPGIEFNKNTPKPSKKANELDGKSWLQYSISVWNDIKKTKEEKELKHPAMFPKELPKRIIQMFLTEDKKVVLDPFLGVASTLLAAKETGKHGIGFEISEKYAKIAQQRLNQQPELFQSVHIPQVIYNENAKDLSKYLPIESVDLCVTSPPYWDILTAKRTADLKPIKNYEEKKGNLGEIHDYKAFLDELKFVFEEVYIVLKKLAYCVVVVMDIRKKDKYYPFHIDVTRFMHEIGFMLDDIIIWDRRSEYNNLSPLGYPSVFRVNKIHEYILIFLKP